MEEGVAELVGEVVHLVIGRLRRVAQDDTSVALTHGQVAALDVGRRTAAHLRGIRSTGGGEPPGDPGRGRCAEVVGVGGHGVPIPLLQEGVQQTRGEQGGVDVAVPRRTPLELGVGLPLHGSQIISAELGLAVLQEVQGQAVNLDLGVPGQHLEGVLAGAEGVHEDQRQAHTVAPTRCQNLIDQQVQEGLAVTYRQKGLGAIQAHRGAQAPVEPDEDRLAQRLASLLLTDLDVSKGVDLRQGLDGLLGDESRGSRFQGLVVVREDRDGLLGDTGVAHLVLGCSESVLAHDAQPIPA